MVLRLDMPMHHDTSCFTQGCAFLQLFMHVVFGAYVSVLYISEVAGVRAQRPQPGNRFVSCVRASGRSRTRREISYGYLGEFAIYMLSSSSCRWPLLFPFGYPVEFAGYSPSSSRQPLLFTSCFFFAAASYHRFDFVQYCHQWCECQGPLETWRKTTASEQLQAPAIINDHVM